MSSGLIRTKDAQNYSKMNVFERLTMKKNIPQTTAMTKSHITSKQKLPMSSVPQTSRSHVSSKGIREKPQKEVQKLTLPSNDYSYVMFPVQYAENGLVIELESQPKNNRCKIQMDYNRYDILVNEIHHHFSMPIMQMTIKMIKVILSEQWFPNCSITVSRLKGKIKEGKIETNTVFNLFMSKDLVEIDPFKEIEEAELRRKKMLLKQIPKLKIEKIYSKTELDESSFQQDEFKQKSIFGDCIPKTPKPLNKNELCFSPSPHRKMIKSDFFKLLTPRSRLLPTPVPEKSKFQQEFNKKINLDQTMPSLNGFDSGKKTVTFFEKSDTKQISSQNSKILSSVTKSKGNVYCSPKRV